MHRFMLVLASLAAVIGLAAPASALSPWVPEEGDLTVGVETVYETFDEFYRNRDLTSFPPGDLGQISARILFDYGFWEDFAADARIGFTGTFAPTIPGEHGLDDTYLGVRWRLLDEFAADARWMPTVTLRLGGIIAGTYDVGTFPASPGDGASGGEVQLAVGKLAWRGIVISGMGGYRIRDNDVPSDWQLRGTLSRSFFDRFSLSAGVHHRQATGGLNLGDADFTPDRAPELREVYTNLEFGTGVVDSRGLGYDLVYAWTVDGRNVGKKHVIGFNLSIPFRLGRE